MPKRTARSGAVGRVVDACRSCDDTRTLRLAVLEELRTAIGFDAYAWLVTDPETEVGAAPLADVPCIDELPRLIRLKYLTSGNRWTSMEGAVALLGAGTRDDRARSSGWRELLAGHGVIDVASLVFRDTFGCWGFLDLWRIEGSSFTAADADSLGRIAPSVTAALRRCQARTLDRLPPVTDRAGPVVLVLSPELDVRAQTPDTERHLTELLPPAADRRPIPAGAYNVAAQLLAVEAGVDLHPPFARVHLGGGVWLTLRASRIGDAVPIDQRDIAVSIEAATAAERFGVFVRAHGLSAREGELLGDLAAGSDTRRVAAEMYLSEHTVQDHLKSIFAKTGTRNRRAVLARALGR